ncbi:Uncharacterised protein [Staphylococcus gallinarum]|uniref:Uncharacterized protein n=1 Tax=Staphylococcus gallinarum TaxID=1293 RepID=A0A380FA51_STAGA|nr:Uncharacterised protein [Staphylococcus gallinarum]
MADKVKNIRMTHTKQSIINAFFALVSKKDFEKITIADITKRGSSEQSNILCTFLKINMI